MKTRSVTENEVLWDLIKTSALDAIAKIALYQQALKSGTVPSDVAVLVNRFGYKALFDDPSSNVATFYSYRELAGIQELIAAVQANDTVAAKFSLPDSAGATIRSGVLPHEVAMVPLVLAERYIARGLKNPNDDVLARLYSDQESYLFGEDLRADVLVPIPGVRYSQSRKFSDYSIIRVTPKLRDVFRGIQTVSPLDVAKLSEFEYAMHIKDVSVSAGGHGFYFAADLDDLTEDLIARFFEAMSVVAAGSSAFIQYIITPRGWLASFERNCGTSYPYVTRDYAVGLDRSLRHYTELDNRQLTQLSKYERALRTSHPSIRVATRRLIKAYGRDSDEDRILDLCIGLEALLGSGSGDITYKLCLRAAAILSATGWGDSKEIYRLISNVYSYRSKVVHGTPGPYKKDTLRLDEEEIIHSSRIAAAALCSLLKIALVTMTFRPEDVDDSFVFSALDNVTS